MQPQPPGWPITAPPRYTAETGRLPYRDKDQYEVDAGIEDRQGSIVGIEVKAAASVTAADFRGLRRLAEATGDRFALGLVLYDHDRLVPFGERLWGAPLACLFG